MGFRENLITDWVDKTIEYQDKQFYILDQFEYENKEYIMGFDINTINTENIEAVFLYKLKDDIFEHVEEEELFNNLLMYASGRQIANKVQELNEKYNPKN